jgi:hypothetical protein
MLFFLLILGIPFVIALLALFRPDMIEQAITERPGQIPPS